MLPFPITVNVKRNYGDFGAIRTSSTRLPPTTPFLAAVSNSYRWACVVALTIGLLIASCLYLVFITYEQVN